MGPSEQFSARPSRERGGWRFYASSALLFALATAVLTWPLAREWRSHLPILGVTDALNHTWATWWFDQALFTLAQSPAQLDYLYFPAAIYHPKVIAAPWMKVAALPFLRLGANPFAVTNAHTFVSYVATGVLMTALCLRLTGRRATALVGGFVFAFAISRSLHTLTGHFTQTLTYIYPLVVLALYRVWERPTIGRGLVFGAALALASLVDLMPLAYFVAPVLALMLLFFLAHDRRRLLSRPVLLSLTAGGALAALLVLPLFAPLLAANARGELGWYGASGVVSFSADAAALAVPPPTHPLTQRWPALAALSDQIYGFDVSDTEAIIYAGLITLALTAVGVVALWTDANVRLWTTVALITAVLALGPWLRFAGELVEVAGHQVVLPYVILFKSPFYSWGRTPARFNLATMFALAILAAFGARWLLVRLDGRRLAPLLVGALLTGIVVDATLVRPWPMHDTRPPAFYTTLATDARPVAVLDLPLFDYVAAKDHMVFQMTHGHVIVGGHRDRWPPAAVAAMERMGALAAPGGDLAALAAAGVGYVILHPPYLETAEFGTLDAHLSAAVGPPLFRDDRIVVFALPNAREIAPPPLATRAAARWTLGDVR